MRKSTAVQGKRIGRPSTGTDPIVGLRLPTAVTQAIDEHAAEKGESRSEAIRRILTEYLKRRGLL